MKRILLLSAYDAESHKRWREDLVVHLPEYAFTVLTLPARYFQWRIRGSALSWAMGARDQLTAYQWDAIIATSMVDLAALKGLVPELASVPSVLYCHENQFAYPEGQKTSTRIEPQPTRIEPKIVTLYSALAADIVAFNSPFNRESFLSGAAQLLKKLPDHVPAGIIEDIRTKSCILPVPLRDSAFQKTSRDNELQSGKPDPLTLIWNHRWEYDKGPEALLAIIQQCRHHFPNSGMRWHIVGQQFRKCPPVFDAIKKELEEAEWLGHWGYQEAITYRRLLVQSHIVLSTALHDFQGLAVMDAVAAGCIPILPDAVAYPDFFAREYLYPPFAICDTQNTLSESAVSQNMASVHVGAESVVAAIATARAKPVPCLRHLSWQVQAEYYRALLAQLWD